MNAILAVAAGGAIGSVGRYLMVRACVGWFGAGFPWGTLAVNAIGGVAIGALAQIFEQRFPASTELRAFLIAGILGGFTTFSAFSLEVVDLWRDGAALAALVYVLASVVLAVGGVLLGGWIVRAGF
jgi:fluoride exporter